MEGLSALSHAETAFNQVLDPSQFETLRGELYSDHGKRESFRRELRNRQDSGQLQGEVLGQCQALMGMASEACQSLAQANQPFTKYLHALMLSEQNNFHTAITQCEGLKDFAPAMDLLIECCFNLRDIEKARALISEWEALNAGGPQTDYFKARLCAADGDLQGAVNLHEQVSANHPNFSRNLFQHAWLLDLYGEDEEAVVLYERCCEVPPMSLGAALNLSVLYEDQGRYESALRLLSEVLAEHPGHERASSMRDDVQACMDMIYDEERIRADGQQRAIYETPITDFELTVRSRNCLVKMGIDTLGDLCKKTEQELLSYPNFGETSLKEVQQILNSQGLTLNSGGRGNRFLGMRLGQRLRYEGDLAIEIKSLDVSIRVAKCLEALNIRYLGDLVEFSEEQLLAQKNFGKTSIREIKEILGRFGMDLAASQKKRRMKLDGEEGDEDEDMPIGPQTLESASAQAGFGEAEAAPSFQSEESPAPAPAAESFNPPPPADSPVSNDGHDGPEPSEPINDQPESQLP